MHAPEHWGTSSVERARRTPADDLVPRPVARWTRATTAHATPGRLWRWVQQLTVAPYSYDLLDNLGRPSPPTLTPGADDVRVGQRLLVLFVVDSLVDGEHLTIRRRRRSRQGSTPTGELDHGGESRRGRGPVAEFAITYAVRPDGPGRTRLVATVVLDGTPGLVGNLLRYALAWGDLVMMRRQLTRLAVLAGG